MRIVTNNIEYVVKCPGCGTKWAYGLNETNRMYACQKPQCGRPIVCDGTHQAYAMEKINIHLNTAREYKQLEFDFEQEKTAAGRALIPLGNK